jgi:hypothetical protein
MQLLGHRESLMLLPMIQRGPLRAQVQAHVPGTSAVPAATYIASFTSGHSQCRNLQPSLAVAELDKHVF